jgi:hypothetical protein
MEMFMVYLQLSAISFQISVLSKERLSQTDNWRHEAES